MIKYFNHPFTRRGWCSVCGDHAEELWFHSDWWHNHATDCEGRKIGRFIAALSEAEEKITFRKFGEDAN